ncbi:S8 family peptidase [Spirosoma pollinicola]|uniref:Peptidase S8/S53 domain-containing protein n=1 Tax=Spirosoma pollinicola TaxID=2057025 RepID=A0A2K8YS07_9BACT|nr:S8/S53 family peptidase [Spirosoma pollinicola]AUD00379.1 hypothetical protein CWM47_00220 [Spirosoma pollinicola]
MNVSDPTPQSTSYFDVPFVPENLADVCCVDAQVTENLFRKKFIVQDGLIKIPEEYIVMSDVHQSLDFLIVNENYVLEKEGHSFTVTVARRNNCGPDARTFVLLRALAGKDLRGMANFVELDVRTSIGSNIVGQIHPGPTGGRGSSEGYSNAYGLNRPVLSTDLLRDFKQLNPLEVQKERGSSTTVLATYKSICPIKVAVLDTGLLVQSSEEGEKYSRGETCSDYSTGWNFVDDTPNVEDGHPELHGTRISAIIMNSCKDVELLPVKTANDTGVCELYDILCGLEYARVNKARIINASFSFRINPGKSISLLKTIMNALKKDDIWVVAAAGNAGQYIKNASGNTPPLGQNAPLNLPACYSRDKTKNRVITVTTISCTRRKSDADGKVRITNMKIGECYSNQFVDVGVVANGHPSPPFVIDDHTFSAPKFQPRPGTSYATAYITGLVASILHKGYADGKKQVMRKLNVKHRRKLQNGVRHGNYIKV